MSLEITPNFENFGENLVIGEDLSTSPCFLPSLVRNQIVDTSTSVVSVKYARRYFIHIILGEDLIPFQF